MSDPSVQDKRAWCDAGARQEAVFLARYGRTLGLAANPAKATDPYAHDLMRPADLKTIDTAFRVYPRAVTLNLKDVVRYRRLYGDVDIYFWVRWADPFGQGVWRVTLSELVAIKDTLPLHWYRDRTPTPASGAVDELRALEPFRVHAGQGRYWSLMDDEGNATCSYVVPLMRPLRYLCA